MGLISFPTRAGRAQNASLHGVGLMIANSITTKLPQQPVSISERLMTLQIPLSHHNFLAIISAYAPTLLATEEMTTQFYSQLSDTLKNIGDA